MNALNLFNLAWRNLWRNRRRSLVTIISLAFGVAAVALFAGYTSAVYTALGNSSIHGELIGHLSVNRKGWETQGKLHPEKFLLSAKDVATVRDVSSRLLPGSEVIPRLSASGMLSNGHSSTIFIASGIAPKDLQTLRGPLSASPGALKDDAPTGITIGQGLGEVLGLKVGDSASVLVSTIHGQANAADVDILNAVNTGNVATNDKLMVIPLALAQSLMDAPGRAERLTLMMPTGLSDKPIGDLKDMRDIYTRPAPDVKATNAWRDRLDAGLKQAGLDLEVQTWQEMSAYYRQIKGIYDIIFVMMMTVVLSIVVLSIANAMSMAVVERTREIGTLRAIGVRRTGITFLFVAEALLLVIVGTLAGLTLMALVRYGVNAANVRYVPPGNTISVPIYIAFDAGRTIAAGLVLAMLAVAAAFLPARRAARHSITESLGHV